MTATVAPWRRIGELHGLSVQRRPLWLRADRPLSYLRVSETETPGRPGMSFTKAAIESKNTALTKRYAVVFGTPGVEASLSTLFDDVAIPGLFAAFRSPGIPRRRSRC